MSGTLPDEGIGYLTYEQFDRFRWAVDDAAKLVPWLRVAGYVVSGEVDVRIQSSSGRPLGLPPTWLAAEEISQLLSELNQWPELEDAAKYGAEIAWQFTREVETAKARWPFEDRARPVRHMRCQACDQLTLRYNPPEKAGEQIILRCRDRACGAVMDEAMFGFATKIILHENEMAEKRRREAERARRLGNNRRGRGNGQQVEADGVPVGLRRSNSDDEAAESFVA